jgi:hypothetical protein
MKTQFLKAALFGCAAGLASTSATAASIANASSGLASPDKLISFAEVILARDTVVTTQFSPQGVTFGSNVYYDDSTSTYPNIDKYNLRNYTSSGCPAGPGTCQAVSIFFNNPVTAAAFSAASSPGTSTFEAYLNGQLVDTFTATTNLTSAANYFGFTNITFDQILINPATDNAQNGHALLFDNLQYVTAVPVPAAVWLFGSGLLGLAGIARRKTG